jgi:enoyl-CoA hydratase/3-hydroxyacyl-CoA dehydrogenase
VTDAGLKPRKISRVAVLGGGLMGSGIATALVLSGVAVVLKEVNQQFLDVSGESGDGLVLGLGGSTLSGGCKVAADRTSG